MFFIVVRKTYEEPCILNGPVMFNCIYSSYIIREKKTQQFKISNVNNRKRDKIF